MTTIAARLLVARTLLEAVAGEPPHEQWDSVKWARNLTREALRLLPDPEELAGREEDVIAETLADRISKRIVEQRNRFELQLDEAREAAAEVDRAGGDAPHEPCMGLAAWIRLRVEVEKADRESIRESLERCLSSIRMFDTTDYDDYGGPHLSEGIEKLGGQRDELAAALRTAARIIKDEWPREHEKGALSRKWLEDLG